MLLAHVAIVGKNSPLPDMKAACVVCRKAAVKLRRMDSRNPYTTISDVRFSIEKTPYILKVMKNIRMADKSNIDSGLVRIGFVEPELDVVISYSDPTELNAFIETIEVLKNCNPWQRSQQNRRSRRVSCISTGNYYNYDRYNSITIKQRKDFPTSPDVPGCWFGENRISGRSFAYITDICASHNNFINIPEVLGRLPCLRYLNLTQNQLGANDNWKFLTSPFIRENLIELKLNDNGIRSFPDAILRLKNLCRLQLNDNALRELPEALGNLKNLSELEIRNNQLSVLPSCLYHMQHFDVLVTDGNPFRTGRMRKNKPHLTPQYSKITVPSLFHTVAISIVDARFPFWESNILSKLADYLQSAYRCFCGSVVFCDSVVQVVLCEIPTRLIADRYSNDYVPIAIRCCSHYCYSQVSRYVK